VTIPGPECGTALRVHMVDQLDGDVRLEQLAFSPTLGWYVQKSFRIPGCMLGDLIRQLRKADCLVPRRPTLKRERQTRPDASLPFPRLNVSSQSA
jgi:hypothetical protein